MGTEAPHVMRWTAACVASFGLLRIGELFPQHPKAPIAMGDVRFYDSNYRLMKVSGSVDETGIWPDYLAINLHVTKTDQHGVHPHHVISGATAVRAMWRWCNHKQKCFNLPGDRFDILFQARGHSPLTKVRLYRFVEECLFRCNNGTHIVGGKSFRRGGASEAEARNLPRELSAALGRWRSESMLGVYSSEQAQTLKHIAIGRRIGSAPQ